MKSPELRARESLRSGVRRIGRQTLAAMRSDLARATETGIHDARRRCKTLRALLRLVRTALDDRARGDVTRAVRRLSRSLGRTRDAEVRLATFHALRLSGMEDVEAFLRRSVHVERDRRGSLPVRRRALRAVASIEERWERLALASGDWEHVGAGLERAYRRARKRGRRLPDGLEDDALHAWRRRIKDLLYEVRLLAGIRRRAMKKLARRLDYLGEALGIEHDLAILRTHLGPRLARDSRWRTIDAAIVGRRRRIVAAVRRDAADVFDEKAERFVRPLARWWRAWRTQGRAG